MNLFEQVRFFIEAPERNRFESLALAVFRYQATHVPIYRKYLASLGVDPLAVRTLDQVRPVSTVAFKYAVVENELHESDCSRVFLTSGTSVGSDSRGRHLVPELNLYRASAIHHLRRMVFPDAARMTMLALHPTADRMPESSLAQMITWCTQEFGNGLVFCAASRESVDVTQAIEFLDSAARRGSPICILGTTAACSALFAAVRRNSAPIRLPAGSRLMDTGGTKGQAIPLSPEQVVTEAHQLLGIEPPLVINEYGMTEMCSQLYDATSFNSESDAPPDRRVKLAPPWLRASALDPITLKPKQDGQPGILAFFDLANAGSISALMTEDIGIVRADAVIVLGRAAAADPRGCALAIQQFAEPGPSNLPLQPERIPDGNPSLTDTRFKTVLRERAHVGSPRSVAPASVPASEIEKAAARLRRTVATRLPLIDPGTAGAVFREVIEAVLASKRWGDAIHAISTTSGCPESLLVTSLQALLSPLHDAAEIARRVKPRGELLGFIMPGNVPGAGIHELVIALSAGCAAIVKASSSEPVFYRELAATLRELDSRFGSDFGARVEVFYWPRETSALTSAMLNSCDRVIAFGDDATITQLGALSRAERLIAFGSRFSGAVVMRDVLESSALEQTAEALALDCAMFDQRGCLSPHHIFVEGKAYEFAGRLASSFSALSSSLGDNLGGRLELQDAAAIRRVRETARWRKFGGAEIELWEDPDFRWTVVLDAAASFTASPGFRTVYVSPFSTPSDLERRLLPVRGRIEGFAIADRSSIPGEASHRNGSPKSSHLEAIRAVIQSCGATYLCMPGQMQSPRLEWPHGGGEFVRMFLDRTI